MDGRFSDQIGLPGIGPGGQQRLGAARVFIAGCGGLGASVLQYLAAAGVGQISIMDNAVVRDSDLNRQILCGETDIGISKASRAEEIVEDLNSAISTESAMIKLQRAEAIIYVEDTDLVISTISSWETRLMLSDTCVIYNKPLVQGVLSGHSGMIVSTRGIEGPCVRCIASRRGVDLMRDDDALEGSLGATCGIVGSMMAMEAIRHLVGRGPASAKTIAVDAWGHAVKVKELEKQKECTVCG